MRHGQLLVTNEVRYWVIREIQYVCGLEDLGVLVNEELEPVVEGSFHLENAIGGELDRSPTKAIGVNDRGEAWPVDQVFSVGNHP